MRWTFILLFAAVGALNAATIVADSAGHDDVTNAIAQASAGDTVTIPAGNVLWANSATVSVAITIQGAGIGQTVITNAQGLHNSGQGTTFFANTKSNGLTRITGIEFNGATNSNILCFQGDVWGIFRVDHCAFVNANPRAIETLGMLSGLVDNCIFADCMKTVDVYAGAHANTSFQTAMTLGTTNTVIAEDCTFLYTNWYPSSTIAVSSRGQGGRSCIRFCRMTNTMNIGFSPIIDAHGNQEIVTGQTIDDPPGGTGDHRGTRQFEMYGNIFYTVDLVGKSATLTDLRGGTCLVFSNTFLGVGMSSTFHMREEDGPSGFDFKADFPGYDYHMLYLWENYSQGSLVVTNDFEYAEDGTYIIADTNLFWTAKAGYTPLAYPHPLAATATATGIQNLRVGTLRGR